MEGIHRRLPPIAVTESLRKRFDSKVKRGEPDVRQMHVPGKVGAVTIAKRMGYKLSTVKNVISGYTWKHVDAGPEQLNPSVVASEERRAG